MSARGYALHSVCPQLLHFPVFCGVAAFFTVKCVPFQRPLKAVVLPLAAIRPTRGRRPDHGLAGRRWPWKFPRSLRYVQKNLRFQNFPKFFSNCIFVFRPIIFDSSNITCWTFQEIIRLLFLFMISLILDLAILRNSKLNNFFDESLRPNQFTRHIQNLRCLMIFRCLALGTVELFEIYTVLKFVVN